MNESTPSGLLQIVDYLKQNFNFSALILSGITFVCGLFFRGLTKEFFDERARVAKHKREVARHVLKICNEASTGNFRKPPRDKEHVNSILTDLEGVNEEGCKWMEEFVSSWQTFINASEKKGLSPEDVRFLKDQLDRIKDRRKRLIKWANKIRVGKKYIFW